MNYNSLYDKFRNIYQDLKKESHVGGAKGYHMDDYLINNIKRIGKMTFNEIGIGEMDYTPIKLKPGVYNIYESNGNIIAIHESEGKLKKAGWKNINWKDSGSSVGVDGGRYGFFDGKIINDINRSLKTNRSLNEIPMLNNKDQYLEVEWHNTNDIYNTEKLSKDLKNKKYGLCIDNRVGDGVFKCYTSSNTKAIIVNNDNY